MTPNMPSSGRVDVLAVTFRSLGKSGREWVAHFDLGSDYENELAALGVAWKMHASIIDSAALTEPQS